MFSYKAKDLKAQLSGIWLFLKAAMSVFNNGEVYIFVDHKGLPKEVLDEITDKWLDDIDS